MYRLKIQRLDKIYRLILQKMRRWGDFLPTTGNKYSRNIIGHHLAGW